MAQKRYFNLRDDDVTFDFNVRLLGLLSPGVYRGFDFVPGNTMTLQLGHSVTGFRYTKRDGTDWTAWIGVIQSLQGVIITEDEAVTLPIDANPSAFGRWDTVVCTHRYSEIDGGEQATYTVLKGNPAADPVAPGVLRPLTDTVLGTLFLPAGTAALDGAGVIWNRTKTPLLADDPSRLPYVFSRNANLGVQATENAGRTGYDVYLKDTRVDVVSGLAPNANDFQTTGFYTLNAALNVPTADSWHYLEVHTHDNNPNNLYVSQIAHTLTVSAAASYRRACTNGVWQPWRRMDGPQEITAPNGNFNSYLENALIRISGNPANGPAAQTTNDWIVQVVRANDLTQQLAIEANSATPNCWTRTYSPYFNSGAGGWTGWRRVDSAKVASDLSAYQTANNARVAAIEAVLPNKQNVLPKGVVLEYHGPLVNADASLIFDSTGLGVSGAMLGWALCNGQNGTADKRQRFTVGYDPGTDGSVDDSSFSHVLPNSTFWTFLDGYFNYGKIGNKGGKHTVTLTGAQNGPHSHTTNAFKKTARIQYGTGGTGGSPDWNGGVNIDATIDQSPVGVTAGHENRPPYIVAGFIQKVV